MTETTFQSLANMAGWARYVSIGLFVKSDYVCADLTRQHSDVATWQQSGHNMS